MIEQIQNILGYPITIEAEQPLTFTCEEFGNTYNVAYALSLSNLQFGTLVLNERKSVLVTPGSERECLTIHKGRASAGITFFS